MQPGEADAVLFVSPKIKFIDVNGNEGESPANGTTLLAFGPQAVAALFSAEKAGLGILFNRYAA